MSGRPYDRLKRAFDIAVSSCALVLTMPIQVAIAVLVRMDLGSPVLFRQARPGKDAQIFTLVKFRTMLEPDARSGLTSDEDRLTSLGRVLRSTSLDELPTLVNVLKGDMSLVGPRPLLPEYMPVYTVEQARRHEVRPGITGLAQISGRNAVRWEDRLRIDVEYVETRSPALDLRILARTLHTVLTRRGVAADGHATMPRLDAPSSPPDTSANED